MAEKLPWTTRGRVHLLGHDVPHDGGVISFEMVINRISDPGMLAPRLFAEVRPELADRLGHGDFLVAGRNFLAGKAHNNGLIALKHLGIRILCESMPLRAYQGVVGLAIPCLNECEDISNWLLDGEEISVDMLAGRVTQVFTGEVRQFSPVPDAVRQLVEDGGTRGFLERHLLEHPELGVAEVSS